VLGTSVSGARNAVAYHIDSRVRLPTGMCSFGSEADTQQSGPPILTPLCQVPNCRDDRWGEQLQSEQRTAHVQASIHWPQPKASTQ